MLSTSIPIQILEACEYARAERPHFLKIMLAIASLLIYRVRYFPGYI